jgi:DNA polymerase-1
MLQVGDEKRQYVIDTRYEDVRALLRHFNDKGKTKIGVNLKFDVKQTMAAWGVTWSNIYDCMIAEMVLYQGKSTPKGFYGLQGMSKRYLNYQYYSVAQLALWPEYSLKKNIRSEFKSVGMKPFSRTQVYYGATDVSLPIMIKRKQLQQVKEKELEQCVLLENRFTVVLAEMELKGFYLDADKWLENEAKYEKKLEQSLITLNDYLRDNGLEEFLGINWNSSQQVCVLFEHLKIPINVVDKSNSTDTKKVYKKTVAETHISKYKDKYDIIKPYLNYKHMAKLVSTYGEKFLENVNPVTGRIHSNYYQILNTGRISSSKPKCILGLHTVMCG